MRILFSFVGGRGHAEALLPIARVASTRGHDVAFAAQSAMVPWLETEGFTAFAAGPSTVSTSKRTLIAPDRRNEERVLRDHFAGFIASGRAADLIGLGCEWRPELIVCDEVDFGAMVVAERIGVPRAIVIVLAAGGFATRLLLTDALSQLRANYGLPPDPDMTMLGGDLVVAPFAPSFRDPFDPLPEGTVFMRPSALERVGTPAELPALGPYQQTVYVTLGTIFNLESGDLFHRVLAGLASALANVIVTVGPHIDLSEYGPLPVNTHVAAFIPQAALLPRCDAVVCHGGSGTVVGALAHGVPVVNIPMGADQMHNADRCEELGVGITLDVMSATPDDIRAAVNRVMAEPAYGCAAHLLGDESADLVEPDRVLTELESLIQRPNSLGSR